ncbi:MAG: hypothetical protein WAQ24_00600 [Candidatus Saccharimonadales bacterium]
MTEQIHPAHPSVPLPVRALVAAAGLGIMLSGCSEHSSAVAESNRPPGGVVAVHGGAEAPTDDIANAIAKVQALRSEAVRGGANLDELEKKSSTLTIGSTALQSTIQFRRAVKTAPFPVLNVKFSVDPITLKNAANQIMDPKVRQSYTSIFKAAATKKVLDEVSFNDMEQDEAREILETVEPGLSAQYSDVLDDLDVSGAVIHGYYDPKSILDDIADIRNPELKKKATTYANTPLSGKLSWKYYDELTKRGDAARGVADKASDEYYTGANEEKQRIESGRLVDAAVREAIVTHNAIASPPGTVTLPPLENPAKNIDLKKVVGPKAYYAAGEKEAKPLHQFAEVYVKDGKVTLHFEDGSNVSPESIAQLQRIVSDVTPLMTNAFAAGDLVSIRFMIGKEYDPYFTGNEKEVHMLLAGKDPLSEEQLRQGLVHEVTHAMVNAAFGEVAISKEEAGLVKNACKMLSDETYKQYQQALRLDSGALQRLIDKTDGDAKAVFLKLKEIVDSNTLAEVMDDIMASSIVTERDIEWTNCNDANFADLLVDIGYEAEVKDPNATYKLIKKSFGGTLPQNSNTASASSTASSDGDKYDADFDKLLNEWVDVIHKRSLFERLNESSFARTESWTKEYLGHSRDNAHELMATVVDISLNNPEELKTLLRGINPEQRKAVNAAIDASYFVVTQRHPAIANNLNGWKQQFTVK